MQTKSKNHIPKHVQSVFQKSDIWVTWEFQSDSQTRESLEESSLCFPPHPKQWRVWIIFFLPSASHWRMLVKKEYLFLVWRQHPSATEDFTGKIQFPPCLIAHSRWYTYHSLPHWQELPSSFRIIFACCDWLVFGPSDCSKLLLFGKTTSSKLAKDFHGSLVSFFGRNLLQSNWIKRPETRHHWILLLETAKISLLECNLHI